MKKVISRMGWVIALFGVLILSIGSFAGSCSLLWSYSINGITALSVSESGNFIAVGCEDGYYYIFDTWGNFVGRGHVADAVVSLDIAEIGNLIVGFSNEYTFCTVDGTQISSSGGTSVRSVSMSSDGKFSLACCQTDLFINQGNSMVQQFDIPSDFPFGAVSSDGNLICAASGTSLHIFDYELNKWDYEVEEEIKHLFVSSNGQKITFSTTTKIGYIDTETMETEVVQFLDVGSIQNVAATPSGDIVVFSTESKLVWLKEESIVNELAIDSGIHFLSITDDGVTITGNNNEIQIMSIDGTSFFTHDFESPVTDLDVSSEGDLLVVCTDTSMYMFQLYQRTQSNTRLIPLSSRKSLPLTSSLEEVWSTPVAENSYFHTADVDGDGLTEILLCEKPKVRLFDGNGNLLAVRDFKRNFEICLLFDVDGDTVYEIPLNLHSDKFVFAVYDWKEDKMRDYYLDSLGEDPLGDAGTNPLAVLDTDGDGHVEIIASVGVGYSCKPRGIVSVDVASGGVEWFYQRGTTPFYYTIADINGDDSLEIVVGSMAPCTCPDDEEYPDCEGYVTVLSGTGEKLWEVPTGYGFQRISVSAADIAEHEGTEIIGYGFNTSETWGNLFVLTCDGEFLYDREFDYAIVSGAIADIDGDGEKEIVAADSRGYLTVFSGDLQEKLTVFVVDDVNAWSQVCVNDFNGDGFFEIFLSTKSELFIFDKDLNIMWRKEFPDPVRYGIANFFQCKNTLLVVSDKLYAYSYTTGDSPCPLWEITERNLTEEGNTRLEMAKSAFSAGEYGTSKLHYETALDAFKKLEDRERVEYISDRIEITNSIIFKQNIKIGIIFLLVFDGFLCLSLLYYWFFKKIWIHLGEIALLLSSPVLLGLFQVYSSHAEYLQVFVTYAVPSLLGSGIVILRQNILGFSRTVAAILSGHKDMLVLSITKSDGSYRVSLESIEEKFNPVKESKEVAFSEEAKEDIIKRIEFMVKVLGQISSGTHAPLNYAEGILRENGAVIYKNFIPEDFSNILRAKFLLLEVEDTEIPWELMYSDRFFSAKYALSRRIVTDEPVNVRHNSRRRGRRALIISDPTETLPGANLECDIVYKRLKQKMKTTFVEGNDANARKVANLFGQEFDIIHYAGHVDNGLLLSDGVMRSREVKEFITGTPIVFVNGCKSEELAKAFLLGGAIAYVGTIHPVHDGSAADIAADFYDLCLQYRIGEALRRARESHIDTDLVWASLVMYGDPTLKLL